MIHNLADDKQQQQQKRKTAKNEDMSAAETLSHKNFITDFENL